MSIDLLLRDGVPGEGSDGEPVSGTAGGLGATLRGLQPRALHPRELWRILAERPGGAPSRGNVAALVLGVLALGSWALACATMDPADYTDLGLISAATPWFWLALGGSILAFTCALRAKRFHGWVALFALLVIIAVLWTTPSVIEGTIRVEATYRHVGLADQLARTGELRRDLDAYFNWPGMFAMLGMVQGSAHVPELLGVARWGPSLAALGYLAPLLLIARSLTPQKRLQWLAVGVFFLVNWSGQDYFAPQTLAFWLMLCILGVVMTVIRRTDDPHTTGPSARIRVPRMKDGNHRLWVGDEGVRMRLSRAQWHSVHALLLLAVGASIASHQLTPVMLLLVLFGLWLVGRTPHWFLWFAGGVMFLLWLIFPAAPFVAGHLFDITGGLLGQAPAASATLNTATVSGRIDSGSAQHVLVVHTRIAETLVVWIMAGLGTLLLISARRRIRGVIMLAGLPFLLIPLQAYGGEMLIRAFLFSLPLVSFLVAVFLTSVGSGRARWRGIAVFVVLLALGVTSVLTRYGNERGESFTPNEVTAYSWFFDHTPNGVLVQQMTPNTPHLWQRYATDQWVYQNDAAPGADWSTPISGTSLIESAESFYPDTKSFYVIYTKGEQAMAELMGNIEPGALDRAAAALNKDHRYQRVYHNDDATIWKVTP